MATPAQTSGFLTYEEVEENIVNGGGYFNLFVHATSGWFFKRRETVNKCFVSYNVKMEGPQLLYPASDIPQDYSAVLKLSKTADKKAYVISNLIFGNTYLEARDGEPVVFTAPPVDVKVDFKPGQRLSLVKDPKSNSKFALYAAIGSDTVFLKPRSGVVTAAQDDDADENYNFSLTRVTYLPQPGNPVGPLDVNAVSTYSQAGTGIFNVRIPGHNNDLVTIDIVDMVVTWREQFQNPNTSVWMVLKQSGSGTAYYWSNYGAPDDYVTIEDRQVGRHRDWHAVALEGNQFPLQIVSSSPSSTDLGFFSTSLRNYLEPEVDGLDNILVGTESAVYPFNIYFLPLTLSQFPLFPANLDRKDGDASNDSK